MICRRYCLNERLLILKHYKHFTQLNCGGVWAWARGWKDFRPVPTITQKHGGAAGDTIMYITSKLIPHDGPPLFHDRAVLASARCSCSASQPFDPSCAPRLHPLRFITPQNRTLKEWTNSPLEYNTNLSEIEVWSSYPTSSLHLITIARKCWYNKWRGLILTFDPIHLARLLFCAIEISLRIDNKSDWRIAVEMPTTLV